ncbi:MAG: hypothetical protein AB7I79_18505 [Rhizobiaceae bacterium]
MTLYPGMRSGGIYEAGGFARCLNTEQGETFGPAGDAPAVSWSSARTAPSLAGSR